MVIGCDWKGGAGLLRLCGDQGKWVQHRCVFVVSEKVRCRTTDFVVLRGREVQDQCVLVMIKERGGESQRFCGGPGKDGAGSLFFVVIR